MGNSSTIRDRTSEPQINRTPATDDETRATSSAQNPDHILSNCPHSSEVKRSDPRVIFDPTDKPDVCNTSHDSMKNFDEDLTSSSCPRIPRLCLSVKCPRMDEEFPPVTLEPQEHEWMMCASDVQWQSLQRLLLSDPTFITRKDFVTGFTCLHWAAKFGKHELIAMLMNFAQEHQVCVNINARSSAGYTPLHVAAMHGHVEVLKLLVGAFEADTEARDYNGKRACQYLKRNIEQNILDIVGAFVHTDTENSDHVDETRWRLSRVLQVNLKPLKAHDYSKTHEAGVVVTKQKSIYRKSSFNIKRPQNLLQIRPKTQIIHNTPAFEKEDDLNP